MKDDKTLKLSSKRIYALQADCQALLSMYKPDDWAGFDDIAYQEEYERTQRELESTVPTDERVTEAAPRLLRAQPRVQGGDASIPLAFPASTS